MKRETSQVCLVIFNIIEPSLREWFIGLLKQVLYIVIMSGSVTIWNTIALLYNSANIRLHLYHNHVNKQIVWVQMFRRVTCLELSYCTFGLKKAHMWWKRIKKGQLQLEVTLQYYSHSSLMFIFLYCLHGYFTSVSWCFDATYPVDSLRGDSDDAAVQQQIEIPKKKKNNTHTKHANMCCTINIE